ncbi:hypothetical protein EC396_05705 [Lutibacter sp. HS1-25]|uniref:hypothetical protein n=1 Tax=Lutibacter sp. HS1-25 TaxID=2485000 RepID=UPI00101232A2|nr:hypothetical protein [Lutibacter sp. HS1-25]RXP58551.1 hypothetical protein EC396_05705 [Lutibacter sp. HS1-25]
MKELDLLKKDWNKRTNDFPKVTYNDIYALIHKKSSSIVKWIFVICIVEFIFWTSLNLLIPESYLDIYEQFHLKTFLQISQVAHYIILSVFIYLFYKNFKSISVCDSTNILMQKIIKTRKTVNCYVYYNIVLYVIISVVLNVIMLSNPTLLINSLGLKIKDLDPDLFLYLYIAIQTATLFIMCGLLWLYYKIIYGILLKKLNKNYTELKKMED